MCEIDAGALEKAALAAPGQTMEECRAIAEPIVSAFLDARANATKEPPAALPGVEEIADLICEHMPTFHGHRGAASAILALFLPLAQENERLKAEVAKLSGMLAQEVKFAASRRAIEAESRALAAEQALAEAREAKARIIDAERFLLEEGDTLMHATFGTPAAHTEAIERLRCLASAIRAGEKGDKS